LDPKLFYHIGKRVRRRGIREAYEGRRLIVKEGISWPGAIIARFESRRFCFKETGIAVRLEGLQPWEEKVVLGLYWSSLAKYYFFLTLGSSGPWHDKFLEGDVPTLPIALPREQASRERIVDIVSKLQALRVVDPGLGGSRKPTVARGDQMELGLAGSEARTAHDPERLRDDLERELDEAVFDLYKLDAAERDSVRDMCTLGLEFFYRDHESDAVKRVVRPNRTSGTIADVAQAETGLDAYLRIFLEWWNDELLPDGEFGWRVLSPSSGAPLLAIAFETCYLAGAPAPVKTDDQTAWQEVLKKLSEHAHIPAGSPRIFTDTFFRVVTEHEIIIIKRDERRFWTKTAAREDAEAAMVTAMNLRAESATA
jgi:hypothetical protein